MQLQKNVCSGEKFQCENQYEKHCKLFYQLCTSAAYCNDSYIGETARRRILRTEEHAGKDKESWIFKHSSQSKHPKAKNENFEILAIGYANRRKRKLAEALFIRDEKPSLNKQKESYQLKLFA